MSYIARDRRGDIVASFSCEDCKTGLCECLHRALRRARREGRRSFVTRSSDHEVLGVIHAGTMEAERVFRRAQAISDRLKRAA